MGNEEKKTVKIGIPESLFARVKEQMKTTRFQSVEEYIVHLLREALPEKKGDEQPYTKEEEERIKERLRSLGYLE